MQSGALRHRITIQNKSTTQDAAGEESNAYTDIAATPVVWATVTAIAAQERFVGGAEQQMATVTHRVRIRYRTDLSNRMRVVWEGRALDIEGIQYDARRVHTTLLCREVQA